MTLKEDGSEGFFNRVRSHAEKLDRGETLSARVVSSFEDPVEMLKVITLERVRRLRRVKAGAQQVSVR